MYKKMDDDMKQKMAQIQVDNNFPGLERLVKLVDQKYPKYLDEM